MPETVTAAPAPTAAQAPQVVPQTGAPQAPAPGAPGTPGTKRGMSTKEGFDAFFKQKAQQSTGKAPQAPVQEQTQAAPAVAPQEPPEAAAEPAERPAPIRETAPEPAAEETRQHEEVDSDPEVDALLPKQLIEAINPAADPKAKRDLRRAAFIGVAYAKSGMRLGDIKEYLSVAPTKEVLHDISATAQTAREMMADFRDPSPDGRVRFIQKLAATDMDAFTNLMTQVTDPAWVEKAMPERFYAIAKTGTRNFVESMRREAARTNNQDLLTAAEIAAEFGRFSDEQKEDPKSNLPPEVDERLQELEARDQAHRKQAHDSFVRSAYQAAAAQVTGAVDAIVDQAMPESSYSKVARDEARQRIGNALVKGLGSNPHVVNHLDRLAFGGRYDEGHFRAMVGFMIQQATAALPQLAGPEIERMLAIAGAAKQERAERRTPAAPPRREVASSGGKPSTATPTPVIKTKGQDSKAVFDQWWNHKQAVR